MKKYKISMNTFINTQGCTIADCYLDYCEANNIDWDNVPDAPFVRDILHIPAKKTIDSNSSCPF